MDVWRTWQACLSREAQEAQHLPVCRQLRLCRLLDWQEARWMYTARRPGGPLLDYTGLPGARLGVGLPAIPSHLDNTFLARWRPYTNSIWNNFCCALVILGHFVSAPRTFLTSLSSPGRGTTPISSSIVECSQWQSLSQTHSTVYKCKYKYQYLFICWKKHKILLEFLCVLKAKQG